MSLVHCNPSFHPHAVLGKNIVFELIGTIDLLCVHDIWKSAISMSVVFKAHSKQGRITYMTQFHTGDFVVQSMTIPVLLSDVHSQAKQEAFNNYNNN